MKYYTIYKTTNLLNGKFYIGKHETLNPNDSYLGSGTSLVRAIKKYGKEFFIKEILYIFNTQWEMNLAEKILVVVDFDVSYNLGRGGEGGPMFLGRKHSKESILKWSEKARGKKRPRTKEQIERARAVRLERNGGVWVKAESIENFRKASLEKCQSISTRTKIATSMRNYYKDEENRKKQSRIMKEIYRIKSGERI